MEEVNLRRGMLLGPRLQRAGCEVPSQALACQRELGIDNAKLNGGGAIAIGHPLGCSGARLATTLIHQMARTGASRGIASLCVGVGQGLATVFDRE